jgi:general secretion pathway protein D
VLQLKDGETQVLAGLIDNEDTSSSTRVPGLGDLPVLGALFSEKHDNINKTEIVLSITPRLVRNIALPDGYSGEFWSGTEATLRTRPYALPTAQQANVSSPSMTGGKTAENPAAGNPPTAISLAFSGPNEVKVGEIMKLALRVRSDGGLRSLPFQLSYDPAALQVLEVVEGNFFKLADGKSVQAASIDPKAGKISVSVSRSDQAAAVGEDTLATVVFRALEANPKTQVTLISASPVAVRDRAPNPYPPAPHNIVVTK